ncbi:DUF6153 family protein [Streptomyces sp. NPDC001970]
MTASRHGRAAGAIGHLLLVVVLALGVFVMHTLGHPDEESGTDAHASHSALVGVAVAPDAAGPGPESGPGPGSSEADSDGDKAAPDPATAMDMASLCVAVLLTAWAAGALLRAGSARLTEWLAAVRARLAGVPRSNAPPRPPDLAQLSLLRI